MKDMTKKPYEDFEKKVKENAKQLKQNIRESKYGLLKIIGIELLPVAWGAALGGIGRSTDAHWVPAVPVVMDLFWGAGYSSLRGLWGLVKYGIGVSLPYADIVYPAIIEALNK